MKKLTQKIYKSLQQNEFRFNQINEIKSILFEDKNNDIEAIKDYLLEETLKNILIGAEIGIDLLETLENYYKGESIKIWIPIVPPGINATYGVNCKSKQKVYKTKAAKEWEKSAIMPIRNAANYNSFLIDKDDKLSISILIKGSRHDVDAPIKMILDSIARTLDFDDKIVMNVKSKIKRSSDDRGVLIEIEKEVF